jgi:hypothetical protein
MVLRSAVESFDNSREAGTIPEADAIAILGTRERPARRSGDARLVETVQHRQGLRPSGPPSGKEFVAGGNDLVLGFAGTYSARRHDKIMADQLERLVEEGWS